MARRAKFGQAVRVQPSITGTLISIAREMRNQEDQNVMDAWKNGGEYEGKKVTDEMVLAYWKDRMKNIDKSDPLYDTYNDQVMQLEYGIKQSKMDLAHLQGKISDGQYAQFFIDWAKKVPQNSEFWRVLQKDAAQLLESAKSKSAASAEKARRDAYNNFVLDQNKTINVGTALTDAMRQLATEVYGNAGKLTDNGEAILQMLTQDYAAHPDKYRKLNDALKLAVPGFNGAFTSNFAATWIGNTEQAYSNVATRATKEGYASDYAAAAKGQSDMSSWAMNLNVWPAAQSYERAYKQFQTVWDDPSASWEDKRRAATKLSIVAQTLASQPGIDKASQQMLLADAQRALGQDPGDVPSFGSEMLGHTGITSAITAQVAYATQQKLMMDANPGAYVYAPVTKDGIFDPSGQSPVGILPAGAVPSNAVFVATPGMDGQAKMVATQPHAVYVDDPNSSSLAPTIIGSVMQYQVGGQTISVYGYFDQDKKMHYSLTPPWAAGVTSSFANDGSMHLALPQAGDPMAAAKQIDAAYGTNLAAQMSQADATARGFTTTASTMKKDDKTGVTSRVDITFKDGQFVVKSTEQTATYNEGTRSLIASDGATTTQTFGTLAPGDLQKSATSPSAWTGGDIPGITFDSATAASAWAIINNTSSGQQIATLVNDPKFQQAFIQQEMGTLGVTDPTDPRIVNAWMKISGNAWSTQQADMQQAQMHGVGVVAQDKSGLAYPGVPEAKQGETGVALSFNGTTLKLPSIPSYLTGKSGQNLNVDLNASPFASVLNLAMGVKPAQPTISPQAAADFQQAQAHGIGVSPNAAPTPTMTVSNVTPTPGTPGVGVSSGGPTQSSGGAPGAISKKGHGVD